MEQWGDQKCEGKHARAACFIFLEVLKPILLSDVFRARKMCDEAQDEVGEVGKSNSGVSFWHMPSIAVLKEGITHWQRPFHSSMQPQHWKLF